MFPASGHPSSCRDFCAPPCWLHYCSSCVASEENGNCLERQETGCAGPTSSHTCATHQMAAWVLICIETGDTEKPPVQAMHCGQHQGCATAAQPKVTLSLGGSGYTGRTPPRLQWHLLMANLGAGKAVTQTANECKPHCKAPLIKALEKRSKRKEN